MTDPLRVKVEKEKNSWAVSHTKLYNKNIQVCHLLQSHEIASLTFSEKQ